MNTATKEPQALQQGYGRGPATYRYGHGVQQDDSAVALWFQKAAEQGDAVAELQLGNRYGTVKSYLRTIVRR
jgi:TPR repeat protein